MSLYCAPPRAGVARPAPLVEYEGRMAARADIVPAAALALAGGLAPAAPVASPAREALDESNSPSLPDAASMDAKRCIAPKVRELVQACEGEGIVADAHDAPLAPAAVARLLTLTQPAGSFCLGHPGENDRLVIKRAVGWATLLSAKPGFIDILPALHQEYRDGELRFLGLCVYTYRWTGSAYAKAASHDCVVDAPPSVGDVACKIPGS